MVYLLVAASCFPPIASAALVIFTRPRHPEETRKPMFTKTKALITDKIAEPARNNAFLSFGAIIIAIIALIVAAVRR
jgi:hypothetical protein